MLLRVLLYCFESAVAVDKLVRTFLLRMRHYPQRPFFPEAVALDGRFYPPCPDVMKPPLRVKWVALNLVHQDMDWLRSPGGALDVLHLRQMGHRHERMKPRF